MPPRRPSPSPEPAAVQDAAEAPQAPQEAPQAPGAVTRTVTRTLARPIVHEGALRRPGEVVTLPADVAAVLEPEGHFEPLTPDPQET